MIELKEFVCKKQALIFLTHGQDFVRVACRCLDLIDAHDRRVEAVAQSEDRQQRKENDGSHRNAVREGGIHNRLFRLEECAVENHAAISDFQGEEICVLASNQKKSQPSMEFTYQMSVAYRITELRYERTFNSPVKWGAMIRLLNFCTNGWISFTDIESVYPLRFINNTVRRLHL